MSFKVFISYSTHDLGHVELLKQQLVDSSISVFIAEHSVHPGNELTSEISKAISECDLFILLWSSNAKNSDWVSQEIGRADALGKKILPLMLTEGLSLPGFINGLKWLPVFSDPQFALVQAREIVTSEYQRKMNIANQQKEQEKNVIALLGLGAILLWAFSQK